MELKKINHRKYIISNLIVSCYFHFKSSSSSSRVFLGSNINVFQISTYTRLLKPFFGYRPIFSTEHKIIFE